MSFQVQETNDYSIASKYSMVHRGYFVDDFMQYLSPKLKRRSPLINIGYYVRAVVVNEGIKLFLTLEPRSERQIVSLGAGFDTTFFRLIHGHENINYFEIDFSDVVKRKIRYIHHNENVKNKLISPRETSYGLTSKHYSLISQDMTNIEELQSVLTNIGFDVRKPTLFFSECAVTYMPEESSTKIIKWASGLEDVMFMVYEQINPDDGFGRVMINRFCAIESPLKSVEKYRTKEDQTFRYKSCGFTGGYSVGAFEIYSRILSLEEHKRVLNLEPFDEWEEWHLTSCHYTLSVGTKGLFDETTSKFFSAFSTPYDFVQYDSTLEWDSLIDSELKLYAHSALLIWNSDAVLIIGGFGISNDSKHKRIELLSLLNFKTMKVEKITPPTIDEITWDCLYHTCSLLSDSQNETTFLLYGGRTSPVKHVNKPGYVITMKNDGDNVKISGRKVINCKNYPEGRRRHCALTVNGGVFICGGLSAENSACLKYDSTLEWDSLIDSELKLYAHSALLIWNSDAVLIIGGFGISNDSKHKRIELLSLLNFKTMKVEKITPPTIDEITWDCLYHTCSLLSDSQNETTFLLYGGRTSPVKHVNKPGYVITMKNDGDNVKISGRKVINCKNYPEGRRRHCALTVNGGVFICGGLSAENSACLKVLGDSWLFTHDEQWIKLDSKMSPRFSHSMTGHHDQIFITGGMSEKFETLNDLWSFNISADVWTHYDLDILPRYSHTSHYLNDWIILIGGVNYLSEKQPGICIVNLKDKTFKEFKLPDSNETSPIMLHNHCSIVSSDLDSVCVIGGGGNCFSFGTSFNDYLVLFKWNKILPIK